jgi:hypothetical protein
MRLTLRTLLAYLDDILEPAQAKEIGEKLQESSLAAGLVSRIREVMRRRRLTAPTLSGPGVGIDPNTVAEYLDNTLAPDGVADVEKICLESDMHLAEVAACHQILTLAMGEPVEVTAQTRERMYALGPAAEKFELPQAIAPHIASRELPPKAVNDVLAQADSAPAVPRNGRPLVTAAPKSEIPDYLKSKSNVKRFFGYAGALLVLLVWGVTVFKTSPKGQSGSGRQAKPGVEVVADAGKKPTDEDAANTEPEAGDVAMRDASQSGDSESPRVGKSAKRATIDSAADTDDSGSPAISEGPGKTTKKRRTGTGNPAVADGPVPDPPPVDDDTAVPQPSLVRPAKYVSTDGIALHYSRRDERWFVLPRGELVASGANLAVPQPFQCQLEFENGKALVTVQGHSLLAILPPLADGIHGLDLQRGQFVVRANGSADDGSKPINLRIGIAGELWRLELQAGAACGVMIRPIEPDKIVVADNRISYEGAFYVTDGAAIITDPDGQNHEVKGPDWLEVPLPVPNANGKLPPKRPLFVAPKWMGPQQLSSIMQSKAVVFERKFVMDEAVELSVPIIAEAADPLLSRWATECLGLIEAYGPLVSVLRSQHPEARKAAISELRFWLPQHPDNNELLKAELAKYFPPETAEVAERLLWGFDVDDARNKGTSNQLIDWMGDPELAIRELAFYQVYRLTGAKREYQADASPFKLNASLKSWREEVKKHSGLIPVQKPTPNPQ